MMNKPLVLIIMDGWGLASPGPGNAIAQAKTPNLTRYWSAYPHTELAASGEPVGLPRNEDGNSETGHLNLGAGHIVFQGLPRINMSIADGSFFKIPAFAEAIAHVAKNGSALHLLGLVGSGGVHSSLEHLLALIQYAKKAKVSKLFLHLFTDGRDSPPTSSIHYLTRIEKELERNKLGQIASLCGRYWAMDRDYRWDRTKKAYEALVMGAGQPSSSAIEAVKASYEMGKTDEFIEPIVIVDKQKKPVGLIQDHDAAIFFNFRIDRPRQLTKALVIPEFEKMVIKKAAFDPYAERYGRRLYEAPQKTTTFQREKVIADLFFVTLTEYERGLPVAVAFPPEEIKMPLARVLSENGLRQLHLSETEKERFVTYYFDGQREKPFAGEDWEEIPSPQVATYDLKPEMSARQVTATMITKINQAEYDFILVNFANPDMVGHTGVLQAGIKACEAVDECVGKIVDAVLAQDGCCVVTADHGNVEEMINLETGEVDTEHSGNPVPFLVIARPFGHDGLELRQGTLSDVAPTILHLMEIEKPQLMTGESLIRNL